MLSTPKTARGGIVTRSPVFYGWVVWLVAALGIIATAPGQNFTVSLFIDHFIRDFGLERTTVSGLFSLGTFLAALSMTLVGRQVDRLGNRVVGGIASAIFALVLMALSLIAGPFALLLGFFAIRLLGQGSMWLVSTTAIGEWFRTRRGRMMSLALVCFWLFQGVYVPWLEGMLNTYDWRHVWIVLGIGMGAIIMPITWLLMRDRPEDYGLHPDGGTAEAARIADELAGESWTLREAMTTPIFWVFAFARFIVPSFISGVIFHQVSIFGVLGYESSVAAQTYSLVALCTAIVAFGSGFLVDRLRPGLVLAIQASGAITALFMAMHMDQSWMLPIFAVGLGLTMGNGPVFDGTAWVNLYGRVHQGTIRGFISTMLVLGTSLGPVMYGLSYDLTGDYRVVLWAGIALLIVTLVLSVIARPPRSRSNSTQVG
jgi:MFS family permease